MRDREKRVDAANLVVLSTTLGGAKVGWARLARPCPGREFIYFLFLFSLTHVLYCYNLIKLAFELKKYATCSIHQVTLKHYYKKF